MNDTAKLACFLSIGIICLVGQACKEAKKKDRNSKLSVSDIKIVADSLYLVKKYNEAIPYFDILTKSDTTNGENYFELAFCYAKLYSGQGEIPQAIEGFQRALSMGYHPADCCFQLALCYLFFDDAKAVVYLNRYLKLNPGDPDAIGLLAGAEGRLSDANDNPVPSTH